MKAFRSMLCAGLASAFVFPPVLPAQELPTKSGATTDTGLMPDAATGPVSREEYNALLQRMLELEKRLAATEGKSAAQETKTVAREKEVDESFDEIDKTLATTKSLATTAQSGMTKFLLTGYGSAGFEDRPGGSGKFTAGLSPILLWKLSDRLFFESELEIGLTPNATEIGLEYANLSYLLNNYVTVKAGKFLTPFGTFADRLHASWINKLPDQPLAVGEEGISPFSQVGVQLSGGFALGPTKVNYAIYAANGPKFSDETGSPEEASRLQFDNFTETNSRSYGGRIGFLPVPELELGYSFQTVTGPVDARLHAVDVNYVREFGWLRGTLDVRGQWVWSDAGRFRFQPEAETEEEALAGVVNFANKRSGGYAQVAYRPSKLKNEILKSFELVGRYDRLNRPSGLSLGDDPERFTIGLNYWLSPSTVVKAAYQFDLSDTNGPSGGNSILFQAAMGF